MSAPELSPPTRSPTASAPPSAVRKQVTVLFADLVGSTTFEERVDPETARATLASYFELLRESIEDHAGTIAKFTGDGLLAIFGIPEVAEDDALRAVAAGVDLQRRFRAFADGARKQHAVELGLRVGVNTGELVIGDDDADLVGDVLNTASRLEATCDPGRVLVGQGTWRLTRSLIRYEALGGVRVKGKTEAIETFQVADADEHERRGTLIPLVGREQELTTLRKVFQDTCDTSRAHLVTVIGPPGVGKTRLAQELCAVVAARAIWMRFEPRGATTFAPVGDLVRELIAEGSLEVAGLAEAQPESAHLADVLGSFVGHGDPRSTEESFWSIRRLFEMLAVDQPLCVVIDDIQWAEPLFWDLLDHLVEWTSADVFLLALARPELRELRPELAQPGRRVSVAVALEGLDPATTRELAARLLDADDLPADLVRRLPESTEGNPLFVRELMQMLVEDGVLARIGERWQLTIDAEAIEVPPTILSLLASRVERLPADERQVVEMASVIGTEFDRVALTAIVDDDVRLRLGALIDRLRRKDLVELSGAWAGDYPVYRFHHVLVREAAYRRLLKARRAELHERIGRYLERSPTLSDELEVVIAHHYEQVYRYRVELGTVDDATRELGAAAVARLHAASQLALAGEDLVAAGGYALRALALVDRDDAARSELLVIGGEALLSSGDVTRAVAVIDELETRSNDVRLTAWADCFRSHLWTLTDAGRLVEASELADSAAERLAVLGDYSGVAKARLVRATALARLGRVGDCEAELDLAIAAARAAGDRRRIVAILGAAPLAALWGPGPVDRAGGRCIDVLRMLRITTSSPAVEATSMRCQGVLDALRGRYEAARVKLATSRSTAQELGLRHGQLETEVFAGFVELLAENPAAAETHLRLAHQGLRALGIGDEAGHAGALLARALFAQGQLDEANDYAEEAVAHAGQNLRTAIASNAVLGEIRAAQGRGEEAERLIDTALTIAEGTDALVDHALALRAGARVASTVGDAHVAASRLELADVLFARKAVVAFGATSVAPVPRSDRRRSDGPANGSEPTNRAWELYDRELAGAIRHGHRDQMMSMLTDDFVSVTNERVNLRGSMNRQEFVDFVVEGRTLDGDSAAQTGVLVAVRGRDLCLIRHDRTRDGFTWSRLGVVRVAGDRMAQVTWFDDEEIVEAMDELDQQWVDSGGSEFIADQASRIRHALRDCDVVALTPLFTDDFSSTDRRLSDIHENTLQEWVDSTSTLIEAGGLTVIHRCVWQFGNEVALDRLRLVSREPADWSREFYIVAVSDGTRIRRIEIYSLDQHGEADARCHELTTAPQLANHATALGEAVLAAIANNDVPDLNRLLHDDFRYESRAQQWAAPRQPRTLDRQAYVRAFADAASADIPRPIAHEVLAVRDEDLALACTNFGVGDNQITGYTIIQTCEGRVLCTIAFDDRQLPDAHDQFLQCAIDLGLAPFVTGLTRRFLRAQSENDPETLRGCLADGFVSIDHQSMGMGMRDKAAWLATALPLMESPLGTAFIVAQDFVTDDQVGLHRVHRISLVDDSSWEFWVVGVYNQNNRQIERLENFAADRYLDARARYRELVAETLDQSLRK